MASPRWSPRRSSPTPGRPHKGTGHQVRLRANGRRLSAPSLEAGSSRSRAEAGKPTVQDDFSNGWRGTRDQRARGGGCAVVAVSAFGPENRVHAFQGAHPVPF